MMNVTTTSLDRRPAPEVARTATRAGIAGRRARLAGPLAALAAMLTIGCGDPTGGVEEKVTPHPVAGKVILPDGSPLAEGSVTLVPSGVKGRQATGKVRPDGTFAVATYAEGDGAAEGEYLVRIDSPLTRAGARGKRVSVIPAKYFEEGNNELAVTVRPGENNLEPFKLDNKPPAKVRTITAFRGRD